MRNIWFVFIMLYMVGCNNRAEKPPIQEEKMAKILVDVHVAESSMQDYLNAEKKDSVGKINYSKVFKIHKVSAADFDRSLKLYQKDPSKMEALYKKVLAELEKQDKEARK
jgi:uncharacterized lipoprotein NlpE involved in copper resistance